MSRTRDVRFWLAALVGLCLAIWALRDILGPFVAGAAIAYMLDPLCDRMARAGAPRWLATTVVLAVFGVLFLAVLLLLIPLVVEQVQDLVNALPDLLTSLVDSLKEISERLRRYISAADFQRLEEAAGRYAENLVAWMGTVLGGLWAGGLALIDIASFVIIMPMVAFYLLRDWDKMLKTLDALLPRDSAGTIRLLAHDVDRTLSRFIRGQLLVCIVLGTFYAIALSAVGLQFGLVVGLGAGLLSFMPYVGSLLGFITSTGIALAQFDSWVMWLVVIGIFLFGQFVEGNFLTPRVVGNAVGLHPLWVIFALLAGGSLAGFTGVLLAVPVAAIIGVLVRFGLGRYRRSPYFRGPPSVLLDESGPPGPLAPP